jgi:uncharacterized membrane protein
MNCPKCGTVLPDNSSFCTTCGENLGNTNAQNPNPEQQQQNSTYNEPSMNDYNPNPYQDSYNQQDLSNGDPSKNGLSTASLVMGIIGLVCCGSIFSILAIIFGTMSLKSQKPGFSKAGVILGIVSLVIGIIAMIVLFTTGYWTTIMERFSQGNYTY